MVDQDIRLTILIQFEQDQQLPHTKQQDLLKTLQTPTTQTLTEKMRWVFLLVLQHDPEDNAHALALLDQLTPLEQHQLNPLVTLLNDWLQERNDDLIQKEQLNQNLQETQSKNDRLEVQIKELKNIEGQLVTKPAPPPTDANTPPSMVPAKQN